MSYQVLARKWRPRNFQEMVGQEAILRMLANALEQKRLHHAYLFTGTRGVGKTTLARIFAKSLNCETGITSTPCGKCSICVAIDAGQFLDLFEVDAASRTKVEDTRELLDNVLYPPTQGRYKIYLIDEVHMLSNHSFNALLKTLEEPPEHVKFLLATTDPKRLPITILSRCLQFHLKRISSEQIAKHLQHICDAEKVSYDIAALQKLSQAADGSMRDALSLLDQAIAYGHGEVSQQQVNDMLGSLSQEDLLPLLYALAEKNGPAIYSAIRKLADCAPDFQQLLEEMIHIFHQLALAQQIPSSLETNSSLVSLLNLFSPEDLQLYYQIALFGRRDLPITPSPQQAFEMTLLRMLTFHLTSAPPKDNAQKKETKSVTPQPKKVVEAKQSSTREIPTNWRDILPKLGLSGMAQALAVNCVLEKIEGNKVELRLSEQHQPMLNAKLKDRISDALSKLFNQAIDLTIQITNEAITTPFKQEQAEQEIKLANAKQSLLDNPQIKNLIEMYDATMEVSLVT